MKKENRKDLLFRYGTIVLFILILSIFILIRLVDNTIVSAPRWNAKADSTLSYVDTILPRRGDILAADGSVLATNMMVYTPCLDFRCPKFRTAAYEKAIPQLADSFAYYFPRRTRDQWEDYLRSPLKRDPKHRSRSFALVRDVSDAEAKRVRTFPFLNLKKNLNGFHVNERLQRVRPYGAMARRSIGGVGVDSVHSIPYGKWGLERSLNTLLTGIPGYSRKESLTKAIVDWTDQAPIDGCDVLTTIDINMQDLLENELNKVLDVCKAEFGTAILMEVKTGDIKAIANLELDKKGSGKYIESLNYAMKRFEPGSVVKTFSLMMMMEDGFVPDVHRVIETGGHDARLLGVKIGDHLYTTQVPIDHILEYSSNIAISKLALECYGDNPGSYYSSVKRSGILEQFNSGIAEEVRPRIDSLGNRHWDKIALMSQCFGYYTEISPLYTASIYNAIANGGKFVRPRLVRGLRTDGVDSLFEVTYVNPQICSPDNAAKLRSMLRQVVAGSNGTAHKVVGSNERVLIAGKTGTARKYITGEGYSSTEHRLAFCGFFPYDNPMYTCMVLIAYPTETWRTPESTSGRVLRRVAEGMYARGMLGNKSDFKADTKEKIGHQPTFYATRSQRNNVVNASLCGGGPKTVIEAPKKIESGVPDVLGFGLREALGELETAGYNVEFTGSGYVSGQSPLAGAPLPRGGKVMLMLKE